MAGLFPDDPDNALRKTQPGATSLFPDSAPETERLRQIVPAAGKQNAEQTARVFRLQTKTGLPAELIERNIDTVEAEVSRSDFDAAAFRKQSPLLAKWLTDNPKHAALANDDLANLGALEWIVTAPQRAWSQGRAQVELGNLRAQSLFRDLSADEHKRLDELRGQMAKGGDLAAESWFGKALTGGARQLPMTFAGLIEGAKTGIPTAIGAASAVALAGQAGPQVALPEEIATVPAAAATGYYVGQTAGSMRFGFQQEAGHAYEEFSQVKDELGRPLDDDVARIAAMAAGAINAPIEAFQINTLLRSIPGADKLAGAATRSAVKRALASPTIRGALKDLALNYGKVMAIETSTEVVQRAVTILSGEIGKAASGQDVKAKTGGEIAADLGEEAVSAAQAFTFLSAPGPVVRATRDVMRAREASKNEAFFTALGEGVQQSATFKRMPEKVQEFIAQATKDGPIENVYVDAEAFTQYWQQAGVPPAQVAEEILGSTAEYEQAVASGGMIRIPTSTYATRIAPTEHNAYFAGELRLGPDEMNAREAREFQVAAEQQAVEETAVDDGEQTRQQATERIREDVIGQLVARGYDRGTVEANATQMAAAFATMAERAGVDPMALYQRYGLRVNRPMPDILRQRSTVDQLDALLDRLRAGQVPTEEEQFGTPLSDLLRVSGLRDEGGELAGFDADRELRPFQKRLVREDGQSLDTAREMAAELGYLPDDSTVADFLDLIGEDVRGNRVYPQGRENAQAIELAQTLGELGKYLNESGIDLNAMTNEQIKELLAKAGEQTDRQSGDVQFDQAMQTGTIEVDGVRRPVVNSNGQPIAGSTEALIAFWRWFGDSKVVDEQGRPLVVYHGTASDFESFNTRRSRDKLGAYFAASPKAAADVRGGQRFVMPVYLLIENPLDLMGKTGAQIAQEFGASRPQILDAERLNTAPYQILERLDRDGLVPKIKRKGNDGIIFDDDVEGKTYVAFNPEQIKSAVGNRGTFDPMSGNILYQRYNPQIETPQFQKWSKGADVYDADEMRRYDGGPAVFRLYHGTTGDFTAFNRERANPESDLGAGFYFTNTPDDVSENYAGEGPDLTSKIERRAEQLFDELENDERRAIVEKATGKPWDELSYQEKRGPLKEIARQELSVQHGGAVMPVFVRVSNPIVIGGPAETRLTYEQLYDEKTDEYGEERGTLLDVIQALREIEADGKFSDLKVDQVVADIFGEHLDGDSIGAADLISNMKMSEGMAYAIDDKGDLVSTEIIRQAFERAGFDGYVDYTVNQKFGTERSTGKSMVGMDEDTVHVVVFKPTQIKSDLGNSGAFNPRSPNILNQTGDLSDKRGAIRFGADRQFNIDLFAKANLSTFLHESGHFYLEVMGDVVDELSAADPASLNATQQQMIADYGKLLKWLKVENRQAIGVEQHEQWARGIEAYFMEGKAPSAELRNVFAKFRSWLINIYRSLSQLNVDLSPEVRGVMDRLFATDQEIEAAEREAQVEAMFTDAETAGMSETEFKAYRETVQAASDRAKDALQAKLMRVIQRERQKWWKDEREVVRGEVAAEVYQRREYIALSVLQRGTLPDGSALPDGIPAFKLDRDALVDAYGPEFLKRLPRPYVYAREGGISPDAAASLLGFSSGDELVMSIANTRNMKQLVEAETDQRMRDRYPDPLTDGTIGEQARAAVHNEERSKVIVAEMRALAKKRREVAPFVQAERNAQRQRTREGVDMLRGVPPLATFTNIAEGRVAMMMVRDIRPNQYLVAARKASRLAIEAAGKQDFETAMIQKQRELLNVELYRAAVAAREEADAVVDYMRTFGETKKRARLGKAGQDYLDQIDALLDRFSFARISLKAADRRTALAAWIAQKERDGQTVELPDEMINEAFRKDWREMTFEELTGLRDSVRHIEHLARLKNKLLTAANKRELDAAVAEITESIRNNAKSTKGKRIETRLPTDEAARMVDGWFASHRKLSSLLRQMDGFKDAGPLWEYLMRPINEAGNREVVMNEDATARLAELFAVYKGKDIAALYRKTHIDAIGASMTKMSRMMVALNWGNADNRQKVMDGYGWNEAQVQSILDTLDERDWKFVQATWDFIDSYWPQIEAKEKRVNGIAPEKVVALPVETKFGQFAGGYFPLKYDDRQSAKAGGNRIKEIAEQMVRGAFARSTTKRGHTKARVEGVQMPVRLDFGVIFEHTQQVIHDLSHHEILIDSGRILGRKEVQDTIYETYGDVVYKQVKDALQDIAAGDIPAETVFEKAINHVRTGTTVAFMGWNISTAMLQPFGLTQSMARIGPKWVGRGLARWLRDAAGMENTAAWIASKSDMMRLRAKTQNREINEIRNQVGLNTGRLSGWIDEATALVTDKNVRLAIADSFFWMIYKGQQVADIPTWLGAYEKAMADNVDEATAIALADQAVLDAQGGGQIKDLAGIQRGGPLLKLWTNFYSYFNVTWNNTVEVTKRTNFRDPVSIGRLAVDYLLLYTIPATLGFLMKQALKGGDDDEDKLLEKLVRENLSYMAGVMVGLREIGSAIQGFGGYEGPAGARFFSSLTKLAKQTEQGDVDAPWLRSVNEAAGILLHYPAGQVRRTVEGAAALWEGQTYNPAVLLVGPPKE